MLILLTISSCTLTICPNKETYMKSVEEFGNQINDKDIDNVSDLESLYQLVSNDCYLKYQEELGLKDKKEIWKKVLVYQYKKNSKDLESAIKNTVALFENDEDFKPSLILHDFPSDATELLKDLFGKDLHKAIDSFVEDIDKLGEQLKEMLEEEK